MTSLGTVAYITVADLVITPELFPNSLPFFTDYTSNSPSLISNMRIIHCMYSPVSMDTLYTVKMEMGIWRIVLLMLQVTGFKTIRAFFIYLIVAGITIVIAVPVTAIITAIITIIIMYLLCIKHNKQSGVPPSDYETPVEKTSTGLEMKSNTAYGQVIHTTKPTPPAVVYDTVYTT